MTMLTLLDSVAELLASVRAEGRGPVAVEKYRRAEPPERPTVYVTPLAQREVPEAIGGQYAQRMEVEVRCEVPWDRPVTTDADLLVSVVDLLLAVFEANREVGEARRGSVGEVNYGLRLRRGAGASMYGKFAVQFTAPQGL